MKAKPAGGASKMHGCSQQDIDFEAKSLHSAVGQSEVICPVSSHHRRKDPKESLDTAKVLGASMALEWHGIAAGV